MFAPEGVRRRLRDVELPVLAEFGALVFGLFLLLVIVCALFLGNQWVALIGLACLPVIAVLLINKRWRERHANWRRLLEWRKAPLRAEERFVVQEDENGTRLGMIDTDGHYTVTWEHFEHNGAVYWISQGSEKIFVSTHASNAEAIIKDALRVTNYPCEPWPNLDL